MAEIITNPWEIVATDGSPLKKTKASDEQIPWSDVSLESKSSVSSSELSARARGMLLAAKSFYIGGKKLPYDRVVDYLESDGEQYFNCGLKTSQRLDFTIRMTALSTKPWTDFFGGYSSDSVNGYRVRFGSGTTYYTIACGGVYNSNSGIKTSGIDIIKVGPSGISVNGVNGGSVGSTFGNNDIGIFSFLANGNPVSNRKGASRFYSVTAIGGSDTVADFVFVDAGGEGCMYDRVSGNLFHNAGTGTFTLPS